MQKVVINCVAVERGQNVLKGNYFKSPYKALDSVKVGSLLAYLSARQGVGAEERSVVLRKSHGCVLLRVWFSFVFVSDKLV